MLRTAPLVGFLCGAAVVGAAWLLLGEAPTSETVVFDPDPLGAVALHEGSDLDARLARIEGRLEQMLESLGGPGAPANGGPGLAVRGRAENAPPEGKPFGAAPSAGPIFTEEVLERTLERLEDKKYAKLTAGQLRAEAQRLIRQSKDMNGARDVLERLLKRDLEPDARALALTDLGSVHRTLKDYEASETSLRDAMRTAGMDTETGIKAGYHLVWTYRAAERTDKALAMADELLANRAAPESLRPWLRWAGARMAFDSGDKRRASLDYRALLEDMKGKPAFRQIVRDATAKLKELEEGPR